MPLSARLPDWQILSAYLNWTRIGGNLEFAKSMESRNKVKSAPNLSSFYDRAIILYWPSCDIRLQSRRLHLTTVTFLWPQQCCQILCIFCYFRLPCGNRKVALARATLPIPLYFLQLSCQGSPVHCSPSKVAKNTKNLAMLFFQSPVF